MNALKKILVTGSNGLLGQKLVAALRNRSDIQLIATSRGGNRLSKTSGYAYEPLDVTDRSAVQAIINRYQPDALIHTAGMTQADLCEKEKENCRRVNVTAVEYLAEACMPHKIHLVQLSTDFIFDGMSGPYREEDKPNPLSDYGKSKWAAEKIVMAASLPWTIVRTVLVYGITENMSRSNIVLWAKNSLEKKQPIRAVSDQFRTPTLAEDLAGGCIAIVLKKAGGIYHLAGPEMMSIYEVAKRTAEFFGLDTSLLSPVSTASLHEPVARPLRTGFVIDKARRDFGFQPHSFSEGLALVKKQIESPTPLRKPC